MLRIQYFLFGIAFSVLLVKDVASDQAAKRLYQNLFLDTHSYINIRPIMNRGETVIVYMNLSLAQILDVSVKNQRLTLNVWVMQEWKHPALKWDPARYNNIKQMSVPSDLVWVPDLVLYNNAGNNWELRSSSGTKVTVNYDGTIVWKPPIILESQCDINVKYFPFDIQTCKLKMGTWTHDGHLIDLRHSAQKAFDRVTKRPKYDNCESTTDYAIDLSEYVENGEWDLLEVTARRNIVRYPCCTAPFLDVTFQIKISRKTLFYGINLICPCVILSFLAILVFYLPADSCEKITLCISVFLALTVFLLVIFDLSPPTSLVIPLIVKYLMFTMIIVSLSIATSILVLNVRHKAIENRQLSTKMRKLFLHVLPKVVRIELPSESVKSVEKDHEETDMRKSMVHNLEEHTWMRWQHRRNAVAEETVVSEIELALENVRLIAKRLREDDVEADKADEWKLVSIVLDRVFLILFSAVAILGTLIIFLQAPSIRSTAVTYTSMMADELFENMNYTRYCEVGKKTDAL